MQDKKEPFRFGEKLRKVRERKGLTLKVVAQQAGVSESLVSQIERNKVSPAIDTLLSLADVLDISLEYIFEEYRLSRPVRISPTAKRRKIVEAGITYEEIIHPAESDGLHALESYIITLPQMTQTHRGSYGHPGREFGYIIEGTATLQYETVLYTLNEGDSVSFAAFSPHILTNTSNKILKALWIVTPPQRFV